MTSHAPLPQAAGGCGPGGLVTAAARCWRDARDGGGQSGGVHQALQVVEQGVHRIREAMPAPADVPLSFQGQPPGPAAPRREHWTEVAQAATNRGDRQAGPARRVGSAQRLHRLRSRRGLRAGLCHLLHPDHDEPRYGPLVAMSPAGAVGDASQFADLRAR